MTKKQDEKNRVLVIIDDQLFKIVREVKAGDTSKIKYSFTKSTDDLFFNQKEFTNFIQALTEKSGEYLANIIKNIHSGNFYALNELIIFDLKGQALKDDLFTDKKKPMTQKVVDQYAILLDIYNDDEGFPAGLDIAEGLDQTPFADRIAWISVTGNLSTDFKPYPLIRKREIPKDVTHMSEEKKRATIFLWWGWLFGDFTIEEKDIAKQSSREIVNYLREQTLGTSEKVEKLQESLYLKSGKGSRKGGLAGNIIEPLLWRIETGDQKGKIVNAFLKVLGDRDNLGAKNLDSETAFIAYIRDKNGEIKFPTIYNISPICYCMDKIKGVNFSDRIFESIGYNETRTFLEKILSHISIYHAKQIELGKVKVIGPPAPKGAEAEEAQRTIIKQYIFEIKKTTLEWLQYNKCFEPIIYSKTLIINNMQYFNALYLCDRLEEMYEIRLREIEAKARIWIHGDLVAQNIFKGNGGDDTETLYIIDPKGKDLDYLVDYHKLLSSFTGQGHLEYIAKNPYSKAAHFAVNPGFDPNNCYYVCSPSLESRGMRECQKTILKHIHKNQKQLYNRLESNQNNWLNRFVFSLARQYLGAPPYRDSERFHDEMKFLYYRGVEILNEFCEIMGIVEHRQKLITPEVKEALKNI